MLDGKTNITKATFVASLAKADEALVSSAAAPKLPTKTDEQYIDTAKRVVFARATTFPEVVTNSPADAAMKTADEMNASNETWAEKFKNGESVIEDLGAQADAGDQGARAKLINIGIAATAVESLGCPLNKRNLGQVPEDCVAPVAGLQNWILDPYVKGPENRERTAVAVKIFTGWDHPNKKAVQTGGALIFKKSVESDGAYFLQPRNKAAGSCARGEAYALAN
ncbi:MAG: hypothetical protein R3B54_14870 [Bdellovibrionota bacterium]